MSKARAGRQTPGEKILQPRPLTNVKMDLLTSVLVATLRSHLGKGKVLTRPLVVDMGKAKMRCPNCERPLTLWDLRCAVCHHKLIWLYVVITLLTFGCATGVILLLESI